MTTDDLIVELARAGGPVRRLERPSIRLIRWIAAVVPLTALCVIVIGPRADVMATLRQPTFMALAAMLLAAAMLSAATAFVLSVPGAERSPVQRALPIAVGSVWVLSLVRLLTIGGDPMRRVLALPIHWLCIIEIAGLGLIPGWALFRMLRRAAPLQPAWSAALATLAAVALGAAGTQFLCPIDDPAHHLIGHVLPVAVLTVLGTITGRRSLGWLRRGETSRNRAWRSRD